MAHRLPRANLFLIPFLGLALLHPAASAAKKKSAPNQPQPVRATLKPTLTIPAEPLGFAAPGIFYLGMRNALVSLDFLDEDRILFTFRVPGLLHRRGDANATGVREIRALLLHLPQGNVESDQVWTLHDRDRYLYPLSGGQFLLRDQDQLELVDASLHIKPWLRFPGPLIWVETDPSRQFMITGSSEPPTDKPKPGTVPSPSTAAASIATGDPGASPRKDLVLRIISRSTGQVMLVSHVDEAIHLPLGDGGYLESRRSNGKVWDLSFDRFSGGNTPAGSVDSVCTPFLEFLSSAEFLATTCSGEGDPRLYGFSTEGRRLWQNLNPGPNAWPVTVASANGLRFARESLLVDHAINASLPLSSDDIKGQDVQVFDAATGKSILRAAASPVFDAGGNVALSPSGRRAAILMDSNIQIFDLPAPPPLPAAPNSH
ncbi:MAG TPA: hypothetical protein VG267_15065 [Terracidiphilus sp.]|jgi:hypothetical protein|nr:hypothetical protein [Terracidiphilus sp.]